MLLMYCYIQQLNTTIQLLKQQQLASQLATFIQLQVSQPAMWPICKYKAIVNSQLTKSVIYMYIHTYIVSYIIHSYKYTTPYKNKIKDSQLYHQSGLLATDCSGVLANQLATKVVIRNTLPTVYGPVIVVVTVGQCQDDYQCQYNQ